MRAVSPIISILLIVVITIAAAVSFYAFTSSFSSMAKQEGSGSSTSLTRELQAGIKILDLVNRSGNIYVVVQNNGNVRLTNITLYVNKVLEKNRLSYLDANTAGEIQTSLITSPGEYELQVTTEEGASYRCKKEI
ncbi:hypothetical protein BMS3Bbin15_01912 [archaeon BMS3Bbin15]|nr:hypothetical protein BMS3Bbin15_01912 [archaeon BMS3Bbin15]